MIKRIYIPNPHQLSKIKKANWILFLLLLLFIFLHFAKFEEVSKPVTSKTPVPAVKFGYAPETIIESILLTGDAGTLDPEAARLLAAQAEILSDRLTVLFMGDNIYPSGMPDDNNPTAAVSREYLFRQIQAVKPSGARMLFIPGNHDWAGMGYDGWNAIKREQRLVQEALGAGSFLPTEGCPGPDVYETPYFRFIIMDSEWWLRTYPKPDDSSSGCRVYDPEGIAEALKKTLLDTPADKLIVFVQHHPLDTDSPHRGHDSPQAFNSEPYRFMRRMLGNALRSRPPFICAAGHDHSLQLLNGSDYCRTFIISGAMSFPTTLDGATEKRLFAHQGFGLIRLDLFRTRKVRLTALAPEVTRAQGRVLSSVWLN